MKRFDIPGPASGGAGFGGQRFGLDSPDLAADLPIALNTAGTKWISVGAGEFLKSPPKGTIWLQKPGDSFYVLHRFSQLPPLKEGDVIGLHPKDPKPLLQTGLQLAAIENPNIPPGKAAEAARKFRVVSPPRIGVYATPPPPPPKVMSLPLWEQPPPGKRWQVYSVSLQDPRQLMVAAVA